MTSVDFRIKELGNLAADTLQIDPLGRFYTETKVIPPVDMIRYGAVPRGSVSRVILDILMKPEYRDHYRITHGVDVLAYIAYHEFGGSGENIKCVGWSFGASGDYGKGPVFVYGTHPTRETVAHEMGHLFGLDHSRRGEDDIMSVSVYDDKISVFSSANRMQIEHSMKPKQIEHSMKPKQGLLRKLKRYFHR